MKILLTDGVLKQKLLAKNKPTKVEPHSKKIDYGVPLMRMIHDVSQDNIGLRTGLTQPKIKLRNKEEAQKWGGCRK